MRGDEIYIPKFKLQLTLILGRLFMEYGDINNALKYFKIFRDYCKFMNRPHSKLTAYRYLSFLYQSLNNQNKALIFLKKMLKLAWVLGRDDYELLAYDMIGIVLKML